MYLSHCDGLQYIRINELGAFVIGHTDDYVAQEGKNDVYAFDGTDLVAVPGKELKLAMAIKSTGFILGTKK